MIEAIGTAITSSIGWVGDVVSAVVGTEGELNMLLPLVAIGISLSLFMFGVKVIKGFTFGA